MPPPAKPPMTLKEAKRAYKKEGPGGFRYTASQMARADRLDAREEKRKKELEKERQRVENKRKREDKLERERAVRQKMLDEGRISVEDTWGKVTASQPRLNKFFGQRPALLPSKRATGLQSIVEEGDAEEAGPTAESQQAKTCVNELHGRSQKGLTDVAAGQGPLQPMSSSPVLSPNLSLCQQGRNNDSRVSVSSRRTPFDPAPSPALRELRPSQINSRQLGARQTLNEDKIGSPQRSVGRLWPNSKSSGEEATASDVQWHSESPPTAPTRNEISPGRPAATVLPKNEFGSASRGGSNRKQGADSDQRRLCTSSICLDEDFTDGIDDETFLMLCATQKSLPDDLSTRENSPTSASGGGTPACDSPRTKASPVAPRTNPLSEFTAPASKKLSESFNSVFNEIEDEDFIALAEEVEAEIATPKQTPTMPSVAKKTAPMAPPPVLPSRALEKTRKPPALGVENKIQKIEMPPRKLKGKRRLPWDLPRDDFIDLGPSTQALTLELLQQAEANVR
ncbi:uncharacterized protein Z520_01524 [Fonsecaea multimorphosa CBS 102226]|uniref:Uncharacterized protein n=1 Tax=Fonsecaea multimorphosa CBS 102226 TaxID=1442371 RepID=A0A0D2KAL4_9EURO|nr:uncharacterized protein Z520_01524 [Fonsecaea multimorphosa CBS 102226]KIY03058.1 hypothetical protein Z520_01524 [Fonsecaea multimorphosa CBS 102226]OAL30553.1 hypothetical protein AYO22_01505 [Fonsecaea multimorphosa]